MELIMTRTAVKDVAIYLRKSRDETDGLEDVLHKHESRLTEFAEKMQFNVIETYKEIGTSQYIDARDEMQRLLRDVESGMYDAVLVVSFDRMTRGDWIEYGTLEKVFGGTKTLIITPDGQPTIDFSDPNQMMRLGLNHMMGREEYTRTRLRMLEGKVDGAKDGYWVNGKPPFPYVYDRNTKNIIVDESKRDYYVLMKKLLQEDDMPCYKIAWELNKLGVQSPGGKKWSETAVYRVLTSEVHMGLIAYGKTSGSGHKNKKKPTKPLQSNDKSNWTVNKQCRHEIIKTDEEHAQIMSKLARKKVQPKEPRKRNFYPLTGLLFCSKCKRSMQFMNKPKQRLMIKTCQTHDVVGNRCYNQGMYVDYVYGALVERLEAYEQQVRQQTPQQQHADTSTLELALKGKRSELKELERSLERVEVEFLRGRYDEAKRDRYESMFQRDIEQALDALVELEKSIEVLHTSRTDEERLDAIKVFKEAWNYDNIDAEDLNRLAKAVIDRIEYIREGDNVQLNIQFL